MHPEEVSGKVKREELEEKIVEWVGVVGFEGESGCFGKFVVDAVVAREDSETTWVV